MWLWRPTLGLLLVLLAADASLASSSAASIAPKDSTTAKKDAKAQTAADTINYYTIIIRGEPAPAGSSAPAPNSGPPGSGKPKELVVDSIEDVERLAKKWRQQKQQQQPKKAARTPGSGRDSKEATPAPDDFLKDFLESHSVFGPGSSNKQLEEEPADSNTGEPTEDTELPDQQTSNTDDSSSSSSGSSRSSREREDSSSSQDSIDDVDTEDSRQKEEPEESSSSSKEEEESDNSSSRTRARESERSDGDEEQPQRSSRRQKQQGEQEDKTSRGKERREARGEEERPEHGDSEADAPRRRQQQQQQQADDSPADDSDRKQRSSRSKVRDSDDSEGSSKGRDSEGSSRAKDTDSAGGSSRVRRQQPEEEEDPSEGGNSRRDDSKQGSEERDSRRADSRQRSEEHVDDNKQASEERDSRRTDSRQRSDEREAEAPRESDTTDRERRSYADTREEEERHWQARDADEYRGGYEDGSGSRSRSSEEAREEPEPSGSYPRLEEDGGYFRRPDLHSTCLQVIKATGDASGLSTYDLRCCDHKDDPKVCMRTEDPTYTSFNSHKVAAPASPKSMMEVLKAHGSQKVATCAFTPTDAPCPASEAGHPAGGCQAFKGTCMLAKSASECGCPSGTGTGVLLEVTAFAYRAAALSCSPVFTTAQPDSYYGGYGGGPDPLDDGPPYLGVGVVMKGSGHVLADNDLRARMTFISGFGVPTQPAPIYGRRRQLLSSGRDATIMNEAILRARVGTKAPSPPAVSGMSGLGFGWRAAPPAVSSHSRQSAAVTPKYGPYSLQGPYSSRQPPMAFTPAPSTPLPVPDLPFLLGGRMIIEWIAAPSK